MNDILINIISVVVTVVIIPLITIAGSYLINLIKTKVKNEGTASHFAKATEIVTNSVKSVFQTYVEALKKSGGFDKKAQIEAFNKAKDIALSQFTEETKQYLIANFGDFDNWIGIQIEACINTLKNKM